MFLNSDCTPDVVQGYRIYAQVVKDGNSFSADRNRSTSDSTGDWVLTTGGESSIEGIPSHSEILQVGIPCGPGDDVYLAATLVFDSGFETQYVSDDMAPIRCSDQK